MWCCLQLTSRMSWQDHVFGREECHITYAISSLTSNLFISLSLLSLDNCRFLTSWGHSTTFQSLFLPHSHTGIYRQCGSYMGVGLGKRGGGAQPRILPFGTLCRSFSWIQPSIQKHGAKYAFHVQPCPLAFRSFGLFLGPFPSDPYFNDSVNYI